jgi:hypothetical protein
VAKTSRPRASSAVRRAFGVRAGMGRHILPGRGTGWRHSISSAFLARGLTGREQAILGRPWTRDILGARRSPPLPHDRRPRV